MKKLLIIGAVLAALTCGCNSNQNADSSNSTEQTQVEGASLQTIYETVEGKFSKPLTVLDGAYVTDKFNIPADELNEYIFAQSEDPTCSERITLIRAKDPAKLEEYKTQIESILKQKQTEFENYGQPKQTELLKRSEVFIKNDTLYNVVSENDANINLTIEDNL